MALFEIKNRCDGEVRFSLECESFKVCVEAYIKKELKFRSRADLTDADLTDADLTRADLTRANLTRADLTDANLTDADLTDADLTDADLTRADLTRANLTRADLTRANYKPEIPCAQQLKNLHTVAVLALQTEGNNLSPKQWHSCDTSHCLAGWAHFKFEGSNPNIYPYNAGLKHLGLEAASHFYDYSGMEGWLRQYL